MRSAAAALALGLTLTAAGLSSCATPDDPVQPPEPDPSVTPVYASEEEALAAAEELFVHYAEIANAIGQGGWLKPEHYADVARSTALADELSHAATYSSKGYHQVGDLYFDNVSIQQLEDHGPKKVEITVYACVDVSAVDVIDADGHSAISPGRLDRQPLEIGIDDGDGALKVNRSDAWSGTDFC